jgi:LmbE family N-acetylglucosaminyl deacetylase
MPSGTVAGANTLHARGSTLRLLMRVLHVAPHPDDELLGSPAVLMALAGAGHEIVNLAVSLGRPADRARREAELHEACARAGFALRISSPPFEIGLDDDRPAAQARLSHELIGAGLEHRFGLLVAPSPHDGHHGHEVVGRAAVAAAAALRVPLWMWGLWSDLPLPTLLHAFEQPVLDRILHALSAHESQIERGDVRAAARGRAEATAVLGPERVFGFGRAGIAEPYAEVLCEAVPDSGVMLLGSRRTLDPSEPFDGPSGIAIGEWLHEPSVRDRVGRVGLVGR